MRISEALWAGVVAHPLAEVYEDLDQSPAQEAKEERKKSYICVFILHNKARRNEILFTFYKP